MPFVKGQQLNFHRDVAVVLSMSANNLIFAPFFCFVFLNVLDLNVKIFKLCHCVNKIWMT